MAKEREIDVAFALDGVSCVVGVHALRGVRDGDAYDFAVEIRPRTGLTMAEVHYRLLLVLTQAECGRVMLVDADAHAPMPMRLAERVLLTASQRDAAAARALGRVEGIARRYEQEEADAAKLRKSAAAIPLLAYDPRDMSHVFRLAFEVSFALEVQRSVRGVFVAEERRRGRTQRLDVFVELSSMNTDAVFAAHKRVVERCGWAAGRVLYGDIDMRMPYLAHRLRQTTFERIQARDRADRRLAEPVVRDWAPLAREVERGFASGRRPLRPVALRIEGDHASPAAEPATVPRVLVVHEDRTPVASLASLVGQIDLQQARDGWEAVDLVGATKFDLVISGLRVGSMRGMQIYRTAVAADPELAERFFFLTSAETKDAAPPSSALARVLTSPLDPEEVRRLLGL